MPDGIQGILHFTEYSGRTQEQRQDADGAGNCTMGGPVGRLEHGLNNACAFRTYEALDLPRNFTLCGLHSKRQTAMAIAMIRRGAREKIV